MCRAGLVDVIPLKPGAGSRLVVSDIDLQISGQAQFGVGNLRQQTDELRVLDVVGLHFMRHCQSRLMKLRTIVMECKELKLFVAIVADIWDMFLMMDRIQRA